jgi:hypothetical protein
MKGLAITVFIEDGRKEQIGDCRMMAPTSSQELRGCFASIGEAIVRRLNETGGFTLQDIGVYVELFDVHPAVEGMYKFFHRCKSASNGSTMPLEWKEVISRKGLSQDGHG